MDDLFRILAVLALIAGNAFFVIGEYSVVTARRGALRAAGRARAREAALRLMDDPVRVISTVQVGITAIGILTGARGRAARARPAGRRLPHWARVRHRVRGRHLPVGGVRRAGAEGADAGPRRDAGGARRAAGRAARQVLRPIVWVLQGSASVLLRPFGVTEVIAGEAVRTPEELRALVDEAEGRA